MNLQTRLFPFLALLVLTPLHAQELRPMGFRPHGGAVYDPVRQRVSIPGAGGYTQEWDGAEWSRLPDLGSVAGFPYFESGTGRLIVAQEVSLGAGWPALRFHERDGHEWKVASVPGGPQGVTGMALAYDQHRGELCCFGGVAAFSGPSATTWIFDGASWQFHNVAGPSARYAASSCFDRTRQRVVLFGGRDNNGLLDDTWEWDGAAWSHVSTTVSPSPRSVPMISFDSARGVVVMAGGFAASTGTHTDLWEYDGVIWSQRTSPPIPAGAALANVAYDEARSETLLLGWHDSTGVSRAVFAWDGLQWSPRPGLGQFPDLSQSNSTSVDHTGSYVLQLNTRPIGPSLWSNTLAGWDGNDWQLFGIGALPVRKGATMWPMTNATVVFGGTDPTSGSDLGDTWRWDGINWTQLTPAVSPGPRSNAGAAFHVSQGHALVFGGQVTNLAGTQTIAQTWKFDGVNWQQLTGPQPLSRSRHAMAYDPVRDRVVLHGGWRTGAFGVWYRLDDTLEHDGTSWTSTLSTSGMPVTSTSSLASMAFDTSRQAIVAVVAELGSYYMYEYTGSAWNPLSVAGDFASPHPLSGVRPRAATGSNGHLVVVEEFTVAELLPDPAIAESYGTACTTSAALLLASELPVIGEMSFALEVTLAPSNGLVAIGGADQSANLPMLGCTLLVQPSVASTGLVANAQGFARQPLPIPANPALLAASFYFQAGVLDGTAPNGFTLSRGLNITLGQ